MGFSVPRYEIKTNEMCASQLADLAFAHAGSDKADLERVSSEEH